MEVPSVTEINEELCTPKKKKETYRASFSAHEVSSNTLHAVAIQEIPSWNKADTQF